MKNKLHLTRVKVNVAKDIKNRQDYIGGSDIASILGLNPYQSAYTLWAIKTGLIEPQDISDKEAVWWGTNTELLIGKRFAMKTDKRIKRSSYAYGVKEYPFLRGHVDFLIVGENAGLECKSVGWNGLNYAEGEIPPAHYAQMQFYILLTGRKNWYLATHRNNGEFFVNSVARNDEFIEQIIADAVEFWNHVQSGEPVSVDDSKNTAETLGMIYPNETVGETVDLSKLEGELVALQELGNQKKSLDSLAEKYKNEVKAVMKDAERGETDTFIVTWKTNAKGSRVFRVVEKDV